jgi:hypothetical protein
VSAAYLNQKRSAGYKADGGTRKCSTCRNLVRPVYAGVEHLQCRQIGVMDDPDADVLPGACCKAWRTRPVPLGGL